MSDQSISIVPRQSNYPDKELKAKEVLEWLVSRDIVKKELSDCVLSSENGYAISAGARLVTNYPDDLPFDLIANGLVIITERQIFHTAENGIDELICPNCGEDISSEDWDFLNEWASGDSNNLTCPICNVGTDIHKFKFNPAWGFSNLGFEFWNWPDLNDAFIEEFREKLGCDISIVDKHI